MSEQLFSGNEKKWYEYGPSELILRVLGVISTRNEVQIAESVLSSEGLPWKSDKTWREERLEPGSWRILPSGMRHAKGGLGLDQTADSTAEPGVVTQLKLGGAKEYVRGRILARRSAREEMGDASGL